MKLYESSGSTRIAEQKPKKSVNGIVGTGGMTRSGRCYASFNSRVKKGEESVEEDGVKIIVPREKDKEVINEPVIEVKVNDFSNS